MHEGGDDNEQEPKALIESRVRELVREELSNLFKYKAIAVLEALIGEEQAGALLSNVASMWTCELCGGAMVAGSPKNPTHISCEEKAQGLAGVDVDKDVKSPGPSFSQGVKDASETWPWPPPPPPFPPASQDPGVKAPHS